MGSAQSRLRVTRREILAFRRRVGSLDERLPTGAGSLRRAAWAGLQDSMPRAALLSLHARVDGVEPSTWEHRSLTQAWGPRYQVYVVAKRDFPLFTLARLPEDEKGRQRAQQMAERLAHASPRQADDRPRARDGTPNRQRAQVRDDDGHARDPVGRGPGAGGLGGRGAGHRPGRRAPGAGPALPPRLRPRDRPGVRALGRDLEPLGGRPVRVARELAAACSLAARRRVAPRRGRAGDASAETVAAPARLLPSGDAFFLFLQAAERELLVPRQDQRERLWTSRVWPGALLVDGEIRGTWRRAQHTVRVEPWGRLSRPARDAVEAEAAALPLPIDRPIEVVWSS